MAVIGPGFDSCGDDGLHGKAKWTTYVNGNSPVQNVPGMSGRCFFFTSGGDDWAHVVDAAEEDDTFILGVRWRPDNGWGTDNVPMFQFFGDGGVTQHVSICLNVVSGRVLAKRGTGSGTLLGQSAEGLFNLLETHYIEAKVTLHDSAGVVQVRVDRQLVLDLSGIDTKNGGTDAVFDAFRVFSWGTAGSRTYFDDFYALNGLGGVNDDFLGSGIVEARRASGNGNYSQWIGSDGNNTDNYLLVDDPAPTPDDDTTYVEEDTVGQRGSYLMEDLVSTVGTPKGVIARILGRYTGGGAENIQIFVRRSSTDDDGPTITLPGSYACRSRIMDEDPIAAGAWTISNVNAMEVGQEAVA